MIVAIFSVLGMEVILRLIGASENTIGFARKYLLIISIGAPTPLAIPPPILKYFKLMVKVDFFLRKYCK